MSDGASLEQYLGAAFASFLLVCVTFYFAYKKNFFSFSKGSIAQVTLAELVGVVFTYLLANFFMAPLVLGLIYFLKEGVFFASDEIKDVVWWPVLNLTVQLLFFLLFILIIVKKARKIFWGSDPENLKTFWKNFRAGFIAWLISYPAVIFIGVISTIIALLVWQKAGIEQVAIQYLLNTLPYPVLYAFTIFFIVIVAPFIEEFLFRGMLQGYLRKLGRFWSIFLTALIFSFAHYAPSQGTGNFELIISLFVLSCFLGFIYEKKQSLWAPIGLHASFNAFNILILSIG